MPEQRQCNEDLNGSEILYAQLFLMAMGAFAITETGADEGLASGNNSVPS